MKKTYIIPQISVERLYQTAILAGSDGPEDGGNGQTGAHGEAKFSDAFDSWDDTDEEY